MCLVTIQRTSARRPGKPAFQSTPYSCAFKFALWTQPVSLTRRPTVRISQGPYHQLAWRRWMEPSGWCSTSKSPSPRPWRLPPVLRVARDVVGEQAELVGESLHAHAEGLFEEAREMSHQARLALAQSELGEAHQVEDERRRQDRVAPLPDELCAHLRAEESTEVDEVPRRLPVAEGRDVLDPHPRVGRIAERRGENTRLAPDLRALVAGVCGDPPLPPPPDVLTPPRHGPPGPIWGKPREGRPVPR